MSGDDDSGERSQKRRYAKVGALILGALGLLLGLILLIGGRSWFADRDDYVVESTESVTGLSEGTPVSVLGVQVGSVSGVRLAGEGKDRVRVTLELPSDLTVREGAVARFERQGISELRTVNIVPGPADAEVIPPGGTIPLEPTALQSIFDNAEEVSERAAAVLESVERLADRLDGALAAFLGDGETQGELRDQAGEVVDRVDTTLAQAEATLADLERLIEASRPPLEETLENAAGITERVEEGMGEAGEMKDDFRGLIAEARQLLDDLEHATEMNDDQLRDTLTSLEQAGERVERLAGQLQRDPNQLIFSDAPEPRELP